MKTWCHLQRWRACAPAVALLLAGCASRLLDATDGGAGDGAMNQGVQYQAFSVPTNLPRLSVQKVDGGKQRCTTLLLVGFASGPQQQGLTLPTNWNVERAWQQSITNGACAQLTPPTGASMPTSITGVLKFDANTPTNVAIHAQLSFAGGAVEAMDADNIVVQAGSQ
jgi:hypothetical protein